MNNAIPTLKYLWITIKHKYFVFIAGIKLGCPVWRLIKHDISKFSFKELPHYGRQFFGDKSQPGKFIKAWIHHQNHNKHHWEYWIPRTGHNRCEPPYPDNEPVLMSEDIVLEMIADWIGASRAYEKKWPKLETWNWYNNNFHKIRVHPKTKFLIDNIIRKAQSDGLL